MKFKIILLLVFPILAISQQKNQISTDLINNSTIFILGEVVVTANKTADTLSRITSETMQLQNKTNVSKALNLLPGINLTASGARNESMVTVRGFDLRQVTVYMDGIPVYVPYDGYVDLARFTTFDLSVINVSKGFSSVLFGPNSLGGTINLVSRKPIKKLDVNGSMGLIDTNGYSSNVNIGSNLGKFYAQFGYSCLHRDYYNMSSSFVPTKNEDGNKRDNSYLTDQKISFKIGWTPNKKSEYAFGYINQKSEKANPAYTGNDVKNSLLAKPRFWQWPEWNIENYYFISNTNLDSKNRINTRFYYDKFNNLLNSYDDKTFTTQTKPYAFQSKYDDYSIGGNVEYNTKLLAKNELKIAFLLKQDVHRENNLNEPFRRFIDNTLTIGLEDIYAINDKMTIIPGISFDARTNKEAQDYNSTTKVISDFEEAPASNAFNTQIGFYYQLNQQNKIGATIAKKTRFATFKDRYSYKMGTAIPNPVLAPETAVNYELNYSTNTIEKITFTTAVFYSSLNDAIINVNNVKPGKSQMQNFGKAEYMGFEAQVNYAVLQELLLSANYTFIQRNNLTDPTIYFTDVPKNKAIGTIQYQPIKAVLILATAEYNSSRVSTSYGTTAPDYSIFGINASCEVAKYFSVNAGFNNILDRNYSLVEGYPEEGRNFFVTLRFTNL